MSQSADNRFGARPDPFIAIGVLLSAGKYKQKQSPPTLVEEGSTTHCTDTAAIAASTALPPFLSTSKAAVVDNGCEVLTIAFEEYTGERPGC